MKPGYLTTVSKIPLLILRNHAAAVKKMIDIASTKTAVTAKTDARKNGVMHAVILFAAVNAGAVFTKDAASNATVAAVITMMIDVDTTLLK